MEKAKVLVVDDNSQMRELLGDSIQMQDCMEMVGGAANGVDALKMIERHQPDILILDLIMPELDGLGVLEKMEQMHLAKKPRILVLSAMGHESVVQDAMRRGAEYYMVKPFDLEVLCNRLREMCMESPQNSDVHALAGSKSSTRSLDEEITSIFLIVGIPAHIKGYHFLREAVKMVIENNKLINSITKELYPGVARRFNTSPSKVERAIRHAIEVAWARGRMENINNIFGYNIFTKQDKPTNGEFIALLADKLLLERSA